MQLDVWTPFLDIEKEMKSLFDRLALPLGDEPSFEFRPTTDMVREDGQLVVTVELPGVDVENDVEISLDGDILTIKGEKSMEKELSDEDRYLHERRYGSFLRRIPLPDGVTEEHIEAGYENGVLTIRVRLPEEPTSERRTIPVKTG